MNIFTHLKKGISAIALSAMIFMVAPAATFASLDFTDAADIPTWATEAIEELVALDILGGNDDGTFAPARQLNRAEVAKIITLASGVDFDTTGGAHFPDVAEDAWYYDYVETMYNYGWIDGYPDGDFRPGNGINRAEIAKMVVNALELDLDITGAPHFDDVSSSDWFFDYVETAYNYDLMRGYADGTFGGAKSVNRAETAKIVYDGLLVVSTPYGPAEGTLEVSLSYETPRGTNVPYNATSVPYTTIELMASDDADVEVSSVTFTRLGLGDNDDFKNVWMEIDGFKVGNDKSINNDDVVELRFNPPIVVPAGQTLVADVVASAKYVVGAGNDHNIGHHNRLALVSADDVASTAMNVVGDFPIEGEEMEVADYKVSEIDFGVLGSDTTIDVGDQFIEIGKFRMLNESSTNKDIELRAVTFKNDGTAELEDVLEDVALYVSGEQVSAESIMDGDYITFRLDNGVTGGYIIEDGDSRIFSVRADIVSAEKGDTINFKVDNFEDIVAIEIGTAFGVKTTSDKCIELSGTATANCGTIVANSDAEDNYARLKAYEIDSGDLNVSRDPSSLGNQQYAPGSNDVVAMTARIIVDQPLLVDGVTLDAETSISAISPLTDTLAGANLSFNNYRLFLNDSLIDSENAMTAGADATHHKLTYDTTFEIVGASILKLVLNIQDGASTTSWIKFTVNSADFASPEYISTGDQVPTTQLLGTATASRVEITVSALQITKTDGFSAETIVAGLDDVTFLEFVLDNNDSGDVNVTSVSILGTATGSADAYGNYTAAIFVDGFQQGSSKNLHITAGTATFNDLSVVIPSAGQKEFAVVINTSEVVATAVATTAGAGTPAANGVATLAVVSSAGMAIGDIVTIAETTAATTLTRTILTVDSATQVTMTTNFASANLPLATDVVTLTHNIHVDITAVDADNVENGQTVVMAPTTLTGSTFSLVASGTLTVSGLNDLSSDILVAGTDDVAVLKVRLAADDDEVQIKDFYFKNVSASTFGPRADFKLYNEAGQLVQTKQMNASDVLHFELANQDRIAVPKDSSTFVTIKVDVRDITDVTMTGKLLNLDLDTSNTGHTTRGIEALTAATGTDITVPASPYWGTAVGENFIAYRSRPSVDRVAPSTTTLVNGNGQELYRFMVTADTAGDIKLDKLSMDITKTSGVAMPFAEIEDASDSGKTYAVVTSAGGTAQTDTYTVSGTSTDEVMTLTVDGVLCSSGAWASDHATTMGVLATAIAAEAGVATATVSTNVITITAAVAGTPVALTLPTMAGTINVAPTVANTAANDVGTVVSADFGELLISAGTSKTFILKGNVSGVAATYSTSVEMKEDLAAHASAPGTAAAVATGNIIWADESSSGADDFMNGYLIKPDTTPTTMSMD